MNLHNQWWVKIDQTETGSNHELIVKIHHWYGSHVAINRGSNQKPSYFKIRLTLKNCVWGGKKLNQRTNWSP